MPANLTAEFAAFRRSVFRIDRTDSPMDLERASFERYLDGDRTPPTEYDWLAPWLAQLARWHEDGKTFTRVRILNDPPTRYQGWLLWGTPWMIAAHENIRYMTTAKAKRIGLPAHEWCMFDEARVIDMTGQTLITGPVCARYIELRDLALANSTSAEHLAV